MRISLEAKKQAELIYKAKENLTWKDLSKKINVSPEYLRIDLSKEKIFLNDKVYKKLCKIAEVDYDKYIVKKLDDNWGRIKGGKNSNGAYIKKIKIPKESASLAELYGIMLGDGNLTKIKSYKIGTYDLRVVGDSRHDRRYLKIFVSKLIENIFGIKTSIYKHKSKNAITLRANGKMLIDFMESKGFKSGDKIKNHLEIPNWIKNNKTWLIACLRGLYDTDGSVYKLTNQSSYQICFTNYNLTLLNNVRDSLISIGINPSKITKNRDILITKRSELRKFLNIVGFRNSRHLNKVKEWNI